MTKTNLDYTNMVIEHLKKHLGSAQIQTPGYGLEGMPLFLENFCERNNAPPNHSDL
jgi:hypothetical protein